MVFVALLHLGLKLLVLKLHLVFFVFVALNLLVQFGSLLIDSRLGLSGLVEDFLHPLFSLLVTSLLLPEFVQNVRSHGVDVHF